MEILAAITTGAMSEPEERGEWVGFYLVKKKYIYIRSNIKCLELYHCNIIILRILII